MKRSSVGKIKKNRLYRLGRRKLTLRYNVAVIHRQSKATKPGLIKDGSYFLAYLLFKTIHR